MTHVAAPKNAARRRCGAFTLPEMIISVGLGVLILASALAVYLFMNRTLDATINYEELGRQSRNSLDIMSTDIRQSGRLTGYATNLLTFTNQDGSLLQYSWDGASKTLTYTNASTNAPGCPRGGKLLTGCTTLKFTIFQRNPVAGTTMTFVSCASTNPSLAKVIVMDWVCRRTNYLTLTDSESVQTAKVVMRN